MPLARGARIGAYEVLDSLGTGATGEVYRARDRKLARTVAIKVLHPGAANVAAVRRFELEARAASALNHPGIVTSHDTGESDGQFYIVKRHVGVRPRHATEEFRKMRRTSRLAGCRTWRAAGVKEEPCITPLSRFV
jgi:serine/threonine protein kinase